MPAGKDRTTFDVDSRTKAVLPNKVLTAQDPPRHRRYRQPADEVTQQYDCRFAKSEGEGWERVHDRIAFFHRS